MIARTWRGWTSEEDADDYLEVLRATGLAAYRATPGNRGAYVLRRMMGTRCQFTVVSLWDSMEAVRSFAGPDPDVAVFYSEDDAYLVERELVAVHHEVISA